MTRSDPEIQRLAEEIARRPPDSWEELLQRWCPNAAVRSAVLARLKEVDPEAATVARDQSLRETHDHHRSGTQEDSAATLPTAPDEARVLPGRIGRYLVEALLGSGSFGAVYRARDPQLERTVAIKVPRPDLIHSAEDAELYLHEARTAAGLDHPAIVPVFDVGQTDRFPVYVVGKIIEGATLEETLAQGPLPVEEAVNLAATVADALHYAHQQGLVHRDVKPGNILLDAEGRPHLADFGLVLRDADLGEGAGLLGTPAYMSPEQARGEGHRVDGRSDVFSLGVVLYEMLAGKRPFRSRDRGELLDQIRTLPPRPLRQGRDDVPPAVEQACLKALAKSVEDRFATAREFADALRAAVPAIRPAAPTSLSRSGWTTWGPAAAAVAALAALWFAFGSGEPERSPNLTPDAEQVATTGQNDAPTLSLLARLTHFRRDAEGGATASDLLTQGSPRERDQLRWDVQFGQPVYAYLVAFNPDGAVQTCLPADAEAAQAEPISELHFPANRGQGFAFTDGPGQQAFLLIVQASPLPPLNRWLQESGCGTAWRPDDEAGDWIWRERQLEPWRKSAVRGLVSDLPGKAGFEALCERAQQALPDATLYGVSFEVRPANAP